MLSRIFTHIGVSKNLRLHPITKELPSRGYSATATHSIFPATFMRLNAGPTEPRECRILDSLPRHVKSLMDILLLIIDIDLKWARLMPNTFPVQEIVRTMGDYHADDQENGVSVERPFIFTIPKAGITLPARLQLQREGLYQVSIQPSEPTSYKVLEIILGSFYSKHAIKQDLDEWLTNHEYANAIAPEDENRWMAT
ncbi:hypothetical protein BDU57DRAFT_447727 [Ampelomyces quisqualis]|uniref:Tse2 ADP-ribosyltransferase toxin domain-containing protein n=1 Tax=Ampelomyces quisqualis TaxID=50730 RepID=A0A6A5QSC0_AMPQU|nr:hypothetical protein BDU57DRAFT_447727 [Ampelomyces quisqualis]